MCVRYVCASLFPLTGKRRYSPPDPVNPEDLYGIPDVPSYGEHKPPDYGKPSPPGYSEPETPGYSTPDKLGYGPPDTPGYEKPDTPGYGSPDKPDYGTPDKPVYGNPEKPGYGPPEKPDYLTDPTLYDPSKTDYESKTEYSDHKPPTDTGYDTSPPGKVYAPSHTPCSAHNVCERKGYQCCACADCTSDSFGCAETCACCPRVSIKKHRKTAVTVVYCSLYSVFFSCCFRGV